MTTNFDEIVDDVAETAKAKNVDLDQNSLVSLRARISLVLTLLDSSGYDIVVKTTVKPVAKCCHNVPMTVRCNACDAWGGLRTAASIPHPARVDIAEEQRDALHSMSQIRDGSYTPPYGTRPSTIPAKAWQEL